MGAKRLIEKRSSLPQTDNKEMIKTVVQSKSLLKTGLGNSELAYRQVVKRKRMVDLLF